MCSSGEKECEILDVYELASELIAHLAPHTAEIVAIKDRFDLRAVLQVVLTISTDEEHSTPALGFDTDVIAFVNTVGATIDVDTYLD